MKAIFMSWCMAIILMLMAAAPVLAEDQTFSKQQLDQMLAPIALYPDDLLSNALMASTYPLDVVEASRWRSDPANAGLTGNALMEALKTKNWDPSIKALVQFPDVLKMMSDQLDWTQKLGDAFLAQQDAVMNEVQFLRSKADASGHLKSNSQQTVTQDDGAYVIRPAHPDTIYVPIYEPAVVYGPWWYPDYPPYYWGYPGAVFTNGFFWGAAGVAIAGGIWGWNHWNWRNRNIDINVNRWNAINGGHHHRFNNNVWKHDPSRRGRIPRGDQNFNRSDIERRLHNSDHSAVTNTFNHGAQLRHNSLRFAKGRGGRSKSFHARGGAGARQFVKSDRAHVARGRPHVRGPAFHARHGGRRGGVRRRR